MTAARIAAGSLVALVLLAPLGRGGTASGAMAVAQILAIGAAAAAALVRPPDHARRPAVLAWAAGFAAWCALGAARADYRFAAFTAALDVLVVALSLWAAWRLGGALRWAPLAGAALAVAVVEAAWSLGQHAAGGERGLGSFGNPNHLAALLCLGAGVAGGRLIHRRGRDPIGWAALACILTAQLVAVASRGALAALAVVAAVLLAANGRRLLRLHRGAALGAAAALALLLVLAFLSVGRRFADPDVYRHARLRIWLASLPALAGHPAAGVGPGMFEHMADRYNFARAEGPVRYGRRFHHPHSQYVEVAVETGAVGLTLFLGAVGAALVGLGRRLRADPDDEIARGALLGLGALAVQAAGEPIAAVPGVALPAAILVGGGLASRGRPRPGRLPEPGLRIAALAVGSGLVYLAVLAPWRADVHFQRMQRAPDAAAFRRELARALRYNPWQPYYYLRAAETILRSVPRLDLATYAICYDYAAKAQRLNPLDPRPVLLRAEVARRGFEDLFHDRASLDEAIERLAAAVALAPTDPLPAARLAGLLLDLGRDAEALRAAEAALAIEPSFVHARRMRGEALRRLGRAAEAEAAARDLARLLADAASYRPANPYEAVILDRETGDARGD